MKIRESGMPEQERWETFFSPDEILKTLGLGPEIVGAAEFGCGYGTFTIPAARLISGKLFAFDIEPEMIAATKEAAARQGVKNIEARLRDFMVDGTGLEPESVDFAMLFNILHLEHPAVLLLEANRILRKNGKIGIVHWNYDPTTPRGPSMAIRPRPEQCLEWATEAGFSELERFDLKPYHYGIVMSKKGG
ncbi:methyltransferase type 11 [candidate division WOR-1 bacterium RIFOXYA12_FULL_52_29]|uniref:Methyltransferase type 11 n=1 Tax=candidate division WOR-1 bacterium RIFOXYC12_FULL_54_18 TaxID=1802584 RepID=A0A1F4T9V0_UNCSA|nr:MAG: methyltransferase type 11 [candidate division WOR-1 bacterium RIFOXYA2_FULL_51_19]OGC18436.1 MAG: methyltransferase type 11 [candidate division WOR-1 bacterium RIFOXYA12_FULL_52_29]OGC27290.1 MAG: methyltransferase type 11 [candidate division WOR-1 bacterium RIFOXYB2_FULL_45_9]OGC28853.1 MAG: methyltransferase type 11 [candidate division WOR-1 bacterium RIFOXYC12_FULL_54_18]OGC30638.1 MAG: methyltransferase type 11 [candidate division WOR-1 bacterium RIFOXYB12_FULL_52_16]